MLVGADCGGRSVARRTVHDWRRMHRLQNAVVVHSDCPSRRRKGAAGKGTRLGVRVGGGILKLLLFVCPINKEMGARKL
jgi:hypothetical protein